MSKPFRYAAYLAYRCSAPTGSGKTVLFELAIIRMLIEGSKNGEDVGPAGMSEPYSRDARVVRARRNQGWSRPNELRPSPHMVRPHRFNVRSEGEAPAEKLDRHKA